MSNPDPYAVADELAELFPRDQAEMLAFVVWWTAVVGPLRHKHLRILFRQVFPDEEQADAFADVVVWMQADEP